MKSPLAFALIAGLTATITSTMAHAQIVLNEVYPNPPGSGTIDDRWEYIEIYGPAGMNLTGYLVASVFGGGDPDSDNIPGPLPAGWDGGDEVAEIDEAWSLDGLTIGSNGLLVIYNNAQSSLARPLFAPGTNFATFQVSHCPTTDVGGRVKNDGSATFTLVRKRPFHALNASGVSLYDGVLATTITNGPLTYPSNIRYAWRKDVNPDVDFNGRIDFNGIGSLLLGGNAPAEIGVNSERAATPAVGGPKFLEPYQMVDDIAWSNGGGTLLPRRPRQLAATPAPRDGGVDINDLLYFLTVSFEAGSTAADLDNDGDPRLGHPRRRRRHQRPPLLPRPLRGGVLNTPGSRTHPGLRSRAPSGHGLHPSTPTMRSAESWRFFFRPRTLRSPPLPPP
jgi:hypothetical protein